MKNDTQKGFTLVEIAMILIVIALLVGGVLKASEMVTNTKLKKMQVVQSGLVSARDLYYDRYREFPGDDPSADVTFTMYTGMPEMNGDGNGYVGYGDDWNLDESTPPTNGEQETLKFFAHLRAAGLIAGTGNDLTRPPHPFDSSDIGIQDGSLGIGQHVIIFSNMTGEYARIIDGWHDDDKADTGSIRSAATTDNMNSDSAPAASYTSSERYHLAWKMAGH